jgi:hypothetical protein
MLAASSPSRDSTTNSNGHGVSLALRRNVPVMALVLGSFGGIKVKFQMGHRVREGMHPGTVTDVGTVPIAVKTDADVWRVLCPWEQAKILGSHQSRD